MCDLEKIKLTGKDIIEDRSRVDMIIWLEEVAGENVKMIVTEVFEELNEKPFFI